MLNESSRLDRFKVKDGEETFWTPFKTRKQYFLNPVFIRSHIFTIVCIFIKNKHNSNKEKGLFGTFDMTKLNNTLGVALVSCHSK